MEILADRFTDDDKAQLLKAIQKAELIIAVKSGDIADVRRLVECQGVGLHAPNQVWHVLIEVANYFHYLDSSQKEMRVLGHAARRGDLSLFEYLVERGAEVILEGEQAEDQDLIAAMLQRRQQWIDQVCVLARDRHLPLIALRKIDRKSVV